MSIHNMMKFAAGIRKRNQGRIDQYYQGQQMANTIGQIGSGISGVIGAYGQNQKLEEQKAAAAKLGALPELGLSPDVARAMAPDDLLRTALTLRARTQMTPLEQTNLKLRQAELDNLPADRESKQKLIEAQIAAETAQTGAANALTTERGRDPTAGYVPWTVTEGDEFNKRGIAPGSYKLPPSALSELKPPSASGENSTTDVEVKPGSALERAGYKAGTSVKLNGGMGAANINQASLSDRQILTAQANSRLAEARAQLEASKANNQISEQQYSAQLKFLGDLSKGLMLSDEQAASVAGPIVGIVKGYQQGQVQVPNFGTQGAPAPSSAAPAPAAAPKSASRADVEAMHTSSGSKMPIDSYIQYLTEQGWQIQ